MAPSLLIILGLMGALQAERATAQESTPRTTAPAATAGVPPAFPIPSPLPPTAELPGDDALDCATLYAESKARIRQNSAINEQALSKTYVKGGETKALETLGTLGGLVPVVGGLISMGSATAQLATTKKDADKNYGESTRQSDWVLDRMVHVSDLYRQRCVRKSGQ